MDAFITDSPNFSVILPVGCNAACKFCDWDKDNKRISARTYLRKLKKTMASLSSKMQQVSITGGEPTLFPYMDTLLDLLNTRFAKIVINTNGKGLTENIIKKVTHVNISRHHWHDVSNYRVFGTTSVPSSAELQKLCALCNKLGKDVSINWVVPKDFNNISMFQKCVEHTKSIGASALVLRKEHSDLKTLPLAKELEYAYVARSKCSVGAADTILYEGLRVVFKYTPVEPMQHIKIASNPVDQEVYELVFQPYGVLTADWAGNFVAPRKPRKPKEPKEPKQLTEDEIVDIIVAKMFWIAPPEAKSIKSPKIALERDKHRPGFIGNT